MDFTPTAIPDVVLLRPERLTDDRGYFSETFRSEWFPDLDFVQDNHSHSTLPNTLRGLHFQAPPTAQAKLLRVVRGRILDVAVDLRRGSPSFLEHVSAELSAEGGEQMLVPEGFAHGFLTLEPDTTVLYKVTTYHSPADERGIAWDDPLLGIEWGLSDEPVLSDRDRRHPRFDPERSPFSDGPR